MISGQFDCKAVYQQQAFLSSQDLRRCADVRDLSYREKGSCNLQHEKKEWKYLHFLCLFLCKDFVPNTYAEQTLLVSSPYDHFFRGLSVLPKVPKVLSEKDQGAKLSVFFNISLILGSCCRNRVV